MGIADIDMPRKIFYRLILFWFIFSVIGYKAYLYAVSPKGFGSQYNFNRVAFIVFALLVIGTQIIVYWKSKFKTKIKILLFTFIAFCFIGLWSIIVSLVRNHVHFNLVLEYFKDLYLGNKVGPLKGLVFTVLDAEGLTAFLWFLIILALGRILLFPIAKFRGILVDCLKIICISEIFQRVLQELHKVFNFIPDRNGSIRDIFIDGGAVFIGLVLVIKCLKLLDKEEKVPTIFLQ